MRIKSFATLPGWGLFLRRGESLSRPSRKDVRRITEPVFINDEYNDREGSAWRVKGKRKGGKGMTNFRGGGALESGRKVRAI